MMPAMTRRPFRPRHCLPLALLPLLGCMKGPQPTPGTPEAPPAGSAVAVATSPRLVKDIPLPGDALTDTDKTLIMGQADSWTGRLVVTTGLSPAEAFAFYQERMEAPGWRLLSATQARTSILTFLRGDRVASIQIEGRFLTGSTVLVIVAPFQGAGPKAPASPSR